MTVFPETQYPDEFRTDTITLADFTGATADTTVLVNQGLTGGPKGLVIDQITVYLRTALDVDDGLVITIAKLDNDKKADDVGAGVTQIALVILAANAPAGARPIDLSSFSEQDLHLAPGQKLGFSVALAVGAGATTTVTDMWAVVSYRTRVA